MITERNIHKNWRMIGVFASTTALAASSPNYNPVANDVYFNTTDKTTYYYTGSAWKPMSVGSVAAASGVTVGPVKAQYIAPASFKALLDTETNDLFAIKAGDIVLDISVITSVASTAACTIKIGTDVDLDGTTADIDSLIDDADAEAVGKVSFGNTTYDGSDALGGLPFVADDDGYITVDSTVDITAEGAFVGSCIMTYIPVT